MSGCAVPGGGAVTSTAPIILGTSNTRKVATANAPTCNTTYGCVPGAMAVPVGFLAGVGATTISRDIVPGGIVRRERLNQLDIKLSKTFRVKAVSILPTFEAANIFNQDKINAVASNTYATTGGTYQIPSSVMQSRIMGFGVQVRW